MTLVESGTNIPSDSLDSSLKKIFGEDFEHIKGFMEVLDIVMHNQKTPAERIHLIKNSGFSDTVRVSLFNINGGITLAKFEYHPNNTDYLEMLHIINRARTSLGKEVLPNGRGENTVEKRAMNALIQV